MKNKLIWIIVIFILISILLPIEIYANDNPNDWGDKAFRNSIRDFSSDDLGSYNYNYGSWWTSKQGSNKWWLLGNSFSQFLQRGLNSGYDALSSSVCEKFVDKSGTPAGVMLGEGGYPVGHIEASYYEYYEYNETIPYLYPDDASKSANQAPGERYQTKRVYKISFEVDPKNIAGSDKITLIFTVGGNPLDLDLTNETITHEYEIKVNGEPFSMKGENVMIKNATKSGKDWKIETKKNEWNVVKDDTEVCIEFSPKEELNPEFSSYLENGNKICNTFVVTESDIAKLIGGPYDGESPLNN